MERAVDRRQLLWLGLAEDRNGQNAASAAVGPVHVSIVRLGEAAAIMSDNGRVDCPAAVEWSLVL